MNPFAICNCHLEVVPGPRRFLTLSNIVEHMTLTSAPSSKSPHMRTASPLGPSRLSMCMNGRVSFFLCSCPTEYRSTISYSVNLCDIQADCDCSAGMKGSSLRTTALRLRTSCSLRLSVGVICLSLRLMTLPLFPDQ